MSFLIKKIKEQKLLSHSVGVRSKLLLRIAHRDANLEKKVRVGVRKNYFVEIYFLFLHLQRFIYVPMKRFDKAFFIYIFFTCFENKMFIDPKMFLYNSCGIFRHKIFDISIWSCEKIDL